MLRPMKKATELHHIRIRGAREHNLKGVDLDIPKKKLVVFTGVSGSGKSSLAFDTLYAEGQRRYVESLSAYARQFLGKLEKPKYDSIAGLSPTISIEQKTTGSNPRSTVGTITELSDYLRVLFARVGIQHCYQCGDPVRSQSAQQIAEELLGRHKGEQITLLAPLLVNRKGEHRELLEQARQDGYIRLRIDGEIQRSEGVEALSKRKKHHVEAVIDRVRLNPDNRPRLVEAVEAGLKAGKGMLLASLPDADDEVYSENYACQACGISFPELSPQAFSFNSPQGMCPTCNGLGTRMAIDPGRVVPDTNISISAGALAPWGEEPTKKEGFVHGFRGQFLKALNVDTKKPWKKLPKKMRDGILYGTGDTTYKIEWKSKSGRGVFEEKWEGLLPRLERRLKQTTSERAKAWYARFLAQSACSTCNGLRLRPESRSVLLSQKSIVDVSRMSVREAIEFFGETLELDETQAEISSEALKEIRNRLQFLSAVGLDYLSLDRPGPSLSGGEAQRIRLASQVGSELTGVIYVLDEPSIGLHQRDNERLLTTLERMRDIGNTVVVVEHDEDTIRAADYVVDFGPGAGIHGGKIVHAGAPATLSDSVESITGAYLSGKRSQETRPKPRKPKGELTIVGATEHNLKNVSVGIPLGVLCVVTGVSGAGKSTLINDILHPELARVYHQSQKPSGKHERIEGLGQLDKVIAIDQKPIGRTPRSNPATYIKVFDEIRKFFAMLPEAKLRGFSPGRFSFNVKGGRCETCSGDGVRKIEMHFLPDVFVVCEECAGRRFNDATLQVKFKGHSIADVLDTGIGEAADLFRDIPRIARPLELLRRVGVEYLKVGQPSPTLSGGEAQRIKLARELSRRGTGRTMYILDEPTTGLHFEDVRKLLSVLHELVDAGNSVLVIEHHLDVIRQADYLIDIGPEGGPGGGKVVAAGPPRKVARSKRSHTAKYL